MHAPTEAHWSAGKRILRYLKGTLHLGLLFRHSSASHLHAFFDSFWDDGSSSLVQAYSVLIGLVARWTADPRGDMQYIWALI
ncbi:hypothetical protein Hanom_Chr02g00140841 [Helianthus anomalus]